MSNSTGPGPQLQTPQSEAAPRQVRLDRLGVIHLLLWMGATTVLLAFGRDNSFTYLSDRAPGVIDYFLLIAGSMLGGAGLASLAVFVLRWRRGLPSVSQPGHVLLLLAASETCGNIAFHLLLVLAPLNTRELDWLLVIAWQLFDFALICGLLFALRMEWRWRGVLGAAAGNHLLRIAWAVCALLTLPHGNLSGFIFGPWTQLGWIPALIAMVIWDNVSPARPDWLHWVGVFVSIGSSILSLLWYFVVVHLHSY